MRKDTVLAHFDAAQPEPKKLGAVAATAKALDISEAAVRLWGELVPPEMAIRAYCASNGELFLDPWLYHDWPQRGRVTKPLEDRRLKRNANATE